MDQLTCAGTIKAALLYNLPGTPTPAQEAAAATVANQIAAAVAIMVSGATITYTAGLIAPSGGGPVTGVFGNTIT